MCKGEKCILVAKWSLIDLSSHACICIAWRKSWNFPNFKSNSHFGVVTRVWLVSDRWSKVFPTLNLIENVRNVGAIPFLGHPKKKNSTDYKKIKVERCLVPRSQRNAGPQNLLLRELIPSIAKSVQNLRSSNFT